MTATLFVNSFQHQDAYSKGGLMIRDNLDDNAAYGAIFVGGSSREIFSQSRMVAGEGTAMTPQSSRPKLESHRTWLRLKKIGTYVTTYHKCEHCTTWEMFDEIELAFLSEGGFYIGIPVTSHTGDSVATFSVSNFKVMDHSPVPLVYMGNNGSPSGAFPLGICEGDCDENAECEVRIDIFWHLL